MGIRNHKSTIRLTSVILIVAFALSMAVSGILFLKNNVFKGGSGRQVIVVVNGEKVYRDEFERELYLLKNNLTSLTMQKKQQLSQMGMATDKMAEIPDEILKEYIFETLINKELLLSSAKELKIKVNNGEIEKVVNERQKEAGGKSNFLEVLAQNGYNLTTYKELLKESETIKKVQEKITSSSKVTEEEVKKTYERFKYSALAGKTFEESKKEITDSLNAELSEEITLSYINKAREKAKIEVKSPEFKKIYDSMNSVIVEKDGYKYTKATLNQQILSIYSTTPQGYSKELEETLKKGMKDDLDRIIKISAKAKAAGIKPTPGLTGIDELSSYSKKYFNYLVDTYKPSEEEMLKKFNANKADYDTQNTIAGYVVGEEYVPSAKDDAAAKKQAEEIRKTVTAENFAAKAKEFSKDPGSAANGGSLGDEVDLTQLVAEFSEAVKKTEKGKITDPVKSQFGYHIIYVQDKNAKNENLAKVSHILITPSVSEETRQSAIKRLTDLKKELEEKKVTWDKVETQDKYNFSIKEQFKTLLKTDSIPGIGKADAALSNRLFTSKAGEILEQKEEFGYFLLTKTSEIPFKEAVFEDVKERIRLEFAIEYANNEIENPK